MRQFIVFGGGVMAAALVLLLLTPVFSGRVILEPQFYVGDFAVRYYGIIMGLAVLAGYFTSRQNAWRFGLSKQECDRIAFWSLVAAFAGARLYFVLFELEYFAANPAEILKVWKGGLSLYGGLIGGAVFVLLWCRRKIYTAWQVMDLAALSLPLAQAIGRFGNLFNYEAYGTATDLPWKMFVPESRRVNLAEAYYHPTFLYEAIASILIFIVLMLLRGRVKSGHLALIYLAAYSAVRFALEFLRTDSVIIGGLKADQLVSAAVFVASVALFFWSKSGRK